MTSPRPTKWKRPQFGDWQAGLGPGRRARNKVELERVFKHAQKSPVARAALDWAHKHDIVFAIDAQAHAGGYYLNGTGIVAVCRNSLLNGLDYAVGTLVHEIRHAWQDHNGLLCHRTPAGMREDNLASGIMRQALYEADAHAHGELARRECQGYDVPPVEILQQAFAQWFHQKTRYYFPVHRDHYAVAFGIKGYKRHNYNTEIRENRPLRRAHGADPLQASYTEKIGRSFAGVHYLRGPLRDRLLRRYLSTEAAQRGYGWVNYTEPVVRDIRKKQITLRLQQPQKRYPLPG